MQTQTSSTETRDNLPSVMICIPTYNSAATIGYVLKNILNQDYPPQKLHIVIVDNESSDGTVEIAKSVLANSSVRYSIVVRRSTVAEARNICLDLWRDEDYLVMWESDNITYRDTLRLAVLFAKERGIDVLGAEWIEKVFQNIEEFEEFHRIISSSKNSLGETIRAFCSHYTQLAFTVLSRRFKEAGLRFDPNVTFSDDIYIGIKANLKGLCVCKIKDLIVYDITILRGKRRLELSLAMNTRRYLRGLRTKAWSYAIDSLMILKRHGIAFFLLRSRIKYALYPLLIWSLILLSFVFRTPIPVSIALFLISIHLARNIRRYNSLTIAIKSLKRVLCEGFVLYSVCLGYIAKYILWPRSRNEIAMLINCIDKCNADIRRHV